MKNARVLFNHNHVQDQPFSGKGRVLDKVRVCTGGIIIEDLYLVVGKRQTDVSLVKPDAICAVHRCINSPCHHTDPHGDPWQEGGE